MFKFLIFITLISNSFSLNNAFNLSPVPNIVIRKPNQISKPQNRSSYFGFSIVLREKSIIIGAPRAQSTIIEEPGAIYKCPLNLKISTAQAFEIACEPFVFDRNKIVPGSKNHSYQWLGAAMDGSPKDSEPLLVCAPRFGGGQNTNIDYMHGICYRSANTLKNNAVDVKPFQPFEDEKRQTRKAGNDNNYYFYYQLGQLGLSAHITPSNDEYIMGSPGFYNWHGTAVRLKVFPKFQIPIIFTGGNYLLNGYAVGSGYLDSTNTNQLVYVTTSPNADEYYGKAFLYHYQNDEKVAIKATLRGAQYGEFYGYALLVSDINGDGLDDIMVTAPQHRINGDADIGAVYTYINNGGFKFTQNIIKAPFNTTSRFGITISNLGDINHDGYKDIAIGAPLFNDTGAIVIYLGGSNGLQTEPSQILKLPSNFKSSNAYFGHGLSKGVDIDGNGFNDLAIGAPNDEKVYIYRAYPVIKVTTSLRAKQVVIKPEINVLEFEVCFQINDEKRSTPLMLTLTADNIFNRLKFMNSDSSEFQFVVSAEKSQKCRNFKTNITFVDKYIFKPLEMELSYSLIKNGSKRAHDFCIDCVVENPNAARIKRTIVKYNPGCKLDICNVELSIKSFKLPLKIIIGALRTLKIIYNITNRGEKAFNTQVTITNSLNLTIARIPSNCSELIDNKLICDIAKDIYPLEIETHLEIEFDLKNITDIKEWFINASITSMGHEINRSNNQAIDRIQFERSSLLDILGSPMENLLSFGEFENYLVIDFKYKFQNLGPSAAKDIDIFLNIPTAFLDKNQKVKNYINITEIHVMAASVESEETLRPHFEGTLYRIDNATENLIKIRQSLKELGVSQNRTRIQMCGTINTALCAVRALHLDSLEIYESLKLQLSIKFETSILREFLKGNQNMLGFYIDATAVLNSTFMSSLNLKKIIQAVAIEYRILPENPVWIYVVALIGGILLLALLTLGLSKIGFFKRSSNEDMLKLWKEEEQLKKAESTIELEDEVGIH